MNKYKGKKDNPSGLNRRNFIKCIAGGTIGIHLTPLPWKLMDDVAIWTQNWSWLPDPQKGAFSQADTICTLCPSGCGISVRKVDEQPIHIKGLDHFPVNSGSICPLGAGGLQLLYNENIRFSKPMQRTGSRGSGRFEPISWDQALKTLAEKIMDLRQGRKPETLSIIDGNPSRSSTALLIRRFAKAVGSPNYLTIPNAEDTFEMANFLMLGHAGPLVYDLEDADFILSFGCGLLEGWGARGRVLHAWGLWRRQMKTKVVQIEARVSNTASKADQWVAIQPGGETALALGLAHVMIKQELYHKEFIERNAFGFEDWSDAEGKSHMGFKRLVLEKYAPDQVARITGLKAEEITALALAFGRAHAPLALFGKNKGDLNGSLFECMAIQALNALKANLNQPGGLLAYDPLPLKDWPEIKADAIALEGLRKPRQDQAGTPVYPFSYSLINKWSENILRAEKSPVDTLLVFSANPVYTLPANTAFKCALEKIPFIVSFSPYKDETALMADLVLPDHAYLEKAEDVVWPTGLAFPFYGLTRPVLSPLYETRHSADVLLNLAGMMNDNFKASFPWNTFEEALKERAAGLFEAGGLTHYDPALTAWNSTHPSATLEPDARSVDEMWEKIKISGFWYQPRPAFRPENTLFRTRSGKFEFSSTAIAQAIRNLPDSKSPKAALASLGIASEEDEALLPHIESGPSLVGKDQFPLLMVPYGLMNLESNWLPNPPYLQKTLFDHQLRQNDSFAEIHPSTATDYRLRNGDRIVISSAKGSIQVRVSVFDGVMPGAVFLPMGFGHTAYDDYQKGKGANPLEILDLSRDPLSGLPAWWNTYVKVEKA